jgi:diguanylate cyclase (GGDEF)-like protein
MSASRTEVCREHTNIEDENGMIQEDVSAPPESEESERADMVVRYIHEVLTLPSAREDLPAGLHGIKKIQEMHALLWEIRKLIQALSDGKLEYRSTARGFVVGTLKALQANLRNLVWESQCIARGEYHHRIHYLNDFSAAFNQMAEEVDLRVNALSSLSEEYREQAERDPLTGLHNRAACIHFAEQLLLQHARQRQRATLIMADIDHFKKINDTYGHLCGDEVLRFFALTLLSVLRSHDVCCRFGGDEFFILMPDTPLETGVKIAERLRKAIEDMRIPFEVLELRITASFGLSELEGVEADQNVEDYLKDRIQLADDNLYKAKSAGRNRVAR